MMGRFVDSSRREAMHPRPVVTVESSGGDDRRGSGGLVVPTAQRKKRSGLLQVTRNASYAGWISAGQRFSTPTIYD